MKTHASRSARRSESGWVMPAAMIASALMISVTVTYARHAVLAKTRLTFEQGARESEEDARSGLERARRNMQRGKLIADGMTDVVTAPDGNSIETTRNNKGGNKRELTVHTIRVNDEEAFVRTRTEVVPVSNTPESAEEPTRLDCGCGDAVLAAPELVTVNGSVTYTDTTLDAILLLEANASLTLQDVVLRGAIVTRAGLCDIYDPLEGSARPQVTVIGSLRMLPLTGGSVPELAPLRVIAPDAVIDADAYARLQIGGGVIADRLDLQGSGAINGPVVVKDSLSLSSLIQRPGWGRGPQFWPSCVKPGAEQVTRLVVRTEDPEQEVLDFMANIDLSSY